jgi:hypothetical protein
MRLGAIAATVILTVGSGASVGSGATDRPSEHVTWVGEVLRQTATVTVGMSRRDLLKVFQGEGGLSTGLSRTYVYRGCPYIKVDVEFEPVGRPARDTSGRVTGVESPNDVIRTISRPYLGWTIGD